MLLVNASERIGFRRGSSFDQTLGSTSRHPIPVGGTLRNDISQKGKRRRARTFPRSGTATGRKIGHVPYISPYLPRRSSPSALFHLDGGASVLELLLEFRSFVLVDAFLDGLGRAFDQVLGFLEAETSDRPHLFNDIDLLLARIGQDDGEFRLLGRGGGAWRPAGSARRGGNGDRRGRRDAPLLFELLGELGRFQNRELRELFDDRIEVGHGSLLLG